MEFKTELHCHSRDASECSHESAEGIAEKYAAAGYRTVCLTNHFSPAGLPESEWDAKIEKLYHAVELLKEAAAGRFTVLMGMELRFHQNSNDYLVFGFDRAFLEEHRDLFHIGLGNFSKIAREKGFLTIQAHPFRNGMTVSDPRRLDGVEVFNGHPGHNSRNAVAEFWAEREGLIKTSGTDHHEPSHQPAGGILTEEPILSVEQLIAVLRSGEYTLMKG